MISQVTAKSGSAIGWAAVRKSTTYHTRSCTSSAVSTSQTKCRRYSTAGTAIATRNPPVFDNPIIDRLKDELSLSQPCFGVRGDEVEVSFEPQTFHQKLLVSRYDEIRDHSHPTEIPAHVAECQKANHNFYAVHRRRTNKSW